MQLRRVRVCSVGMIYVSYFVDLGSNKYEMPSNSTLDKLAAHSEAHHPNHCDVLVTQTRGMTDEEIEEWVKELDAE